MLLVLAIAETLHKLLQQTGSALKHLNLRHNNFDDASAQRFKDALVENESLEFLDLSWNNFQSKGCVLLAEGLKVSSECWFNWRHNKIHTKMHLVKTREPTIS